jgi:hypothetical protein
MDPLRFAIQVSKILVDQIRTMKNAQDLLDEFLLSHQVPDRSRGIPEGTSIEGAFIQGFFSCLCHPKMWR